MDGDADAVAVHPKSASQPTAPAPIVWTKGAVDGDNRACVFVVDHDAQARSALRRLLEANGLRAEVFADGMAFLGAYRRQDNA